ncbi:uncharacterized protein LOC124897108 [Capsicum annuum]|uniref:uncharacterized protein LOC124897108 n=1 Tax=Capsicum annuum TaxID=4072 RepID=UPI001FB0534D|nr:uncharacterized protein LOC124897108 [Capsicum annuum]
MPSVMTPIHKSILTKTTIRANRKDINRHDSKKTILVQSPTPSSFSSEDEDIIVSKKVFDKFRDEEKNNIEVHEARDECVSQNTKLVDGSIVEAQVSESQFTFPNNVLRSIDLDFINKATAEVDADCKITLPDEVLPSLNAYVNLERSIIVHPSANEAQQTPMHFSRIRRPSRYKKSPFTINFDSVDEVQRRTFDQKHPFISHPVNDIEDTKITNKFMTWLSLDLLKYHSKRNNKEEHYLNGKVKIPLISFEILSVEDKN